MPSKHSQRRRSKESQGFVDDWPDYCEDEDYYHPSWRLARQPSLWDQYPDEQYIMDDEYYYYWPYGYDYDDYWDWTEDDEWQWALEDERMQQPRQRKSSLRKKKDQQVQGDAWTTLHDSKGSSSYRRYRRSSPPPTPDDDWRTNSKSVPGSPRIGYQHPTTIVLDDESFYNKPPERRRTIDTIRREEQEQPKPALRRRHSLYERPSQSMLVSPMMQPVPHDVLSAPVTTTVPASNGAQWVPFPIPRPPPVPQQQQQLFNPMPLPALPNHHPMMLQFPAAPAPLMVPPPMPMPLAPFQRIDMLDPWPLMPSEPGLSVPAPPPPPPPPAPAPPAAMPAQPVPSSQPAPAPPASSTDRAINEPESKPDAAEQAPKAEDSPAETKPAVNPEAASEVEKPASEPPASTEPAMRSAEPPRLRRSRSLFAGLFGGGGSSSSQKRRPMTIHDKSMWDPAAVMPLEDVIGKPTTSQSSRPRQIIRMPWLFLPEGHPLNQHPPKQRQEEASLSPMAKGLSRKESTRIRQKARKLGMRQYIWCYRPMNDTDAATQTDVVVWGTFDIQNQQRLDPYMPFVLQKQQHLAGLPLPSTTVVFLAKEPELPGTIVVDPLSGIGYHYKNALKSKRTVLEIALLPNDKFMVRPPPPSGLSFAPSSSSSTTSSNTLTSILRNALF